MEALASATSGSPTRHIEACLQAAIRHIKARLQAYLTVVDRLLKQKIFSELMQKTFLCNLMVLETAIDYRNAKGDGQRIWAYYNSWPEAADRR